MGRSRFDLLCLSLGLSRLGLVWDLFLILSIPQDKSHPTPFCLNADFLNKSHENRATLEKACVFDLLLGLALMKSIFI